MSFRYTSCAALLQVSLLSFYYCEYHLTHYLPSLLVGRNLLWYSTRTQSLHCVVVIIIMTITIVTYITYCMYMFKINSSNAIGIHPSTHPGHKKCTLDNLEVLVNFLRLFVKPFLITTAFCGNYSRGIYIHIYLHKYIAYILYIYNVDRHGRSSGAGQASSRTSTSSS